MDLGPASRWYKFLKIRAKEKPNIDFTSLKTF